MAIPQRSMWDTGWSATDESLASKPQQTAATPPAPAARTPAPPSRNTPAAPNMPTTPAAHQTNAAVIADLARQARAARNDLQVAQEQFARRSLGLLESLRVVDASLVELAVHVLGNEVIASSWFTSRNLHFSQRAPMEMLVIGDRTAVINELMRLEHGVY